jgi:acyl-CoA thioesterase-2
MPAPAPVKIENARAFDSDASALQPESTMTAREFLGLRPTHNPHRWVLPVERGICVRHAGFLFGGCGLGAAVTALEATTGRQLVWATAQYLSYARPPEILDLDVTIPISGHRSSQARATGHVGDREIFTVNASLGWRPLDVQGEWEVRPAVPPPEDCPVAPAVDGTAGTIHSRVELRVARGRYGADKDGTPSEDGHSALWVRIPEGLETSAAALAIIADWMPSGISHALGRWAGGNSLDNTIRIVDVVPSQWILCDIHVLGIRHGFGHGVIHLWSDQGPLLATGSQSFIVRLMD